MPSEVTEPQLSDGVVLLRPLILDAAAAHLGGEDAKQRHWFAAPQRGTLASVRAFIEHAQSDWRAGGVMRNFGVRNAITGVLVGNVEVRDRGDHRANVSVVIFPAFRRRGYALRAVRLACEYAFGKLPIETFVAIIDAENVASRALAESAGFALDGRAEPWEDAEPTGEMLRYVLPAT